MVSPSTLIVLSVSLKRLLRRAPLNLETGDLFAFSHRRVPAQREPSVTRRTSHERRVIRHVLTVLDDQDRDRRAHETCELRAAPGVRDRRFISVRVGVVLSHHSHDLRLAPSQWSEGEPRGRDSDIAAALYSDSDNYVFVRPYGQTQRIRVAPAFSQLHRLDGYRNLRLVVVNDCNRDILDSHAAVTAAADVVRDRRRLVFRVGIVFEGRNLNRLLLVPVAGRKRELVWVDGDVRIRTAVHRHRNDAGRLEPEDHGVGRTFTFVDREPRCRSRNVDSWASSSLRATLMLGAVTLFAP